MSAIDSLTGLRFWAALAVVLYHLGAARVPDNPKWLVNIFFSAPEAVSMFFVLSGFVLTYVYLGKRPTGEVSRVDFWVARFARIYPAYLVALIIGSLAVAYNLRGSLPLRDVATSLLPSAVVSSLLLQRWLETAPTLNGPAWSLSIEAFFYAAFPLAMPIIARWRPKQLFALAGFAWVLLSVLPGVFLTNPAVLADPTGQHYAKQLVDIILLPPAYVADFLFGIASAKLFMQGHSRHSATRYILMVSVVTAICIGAFTQSDRGAGFIAFQGVMGPFFAVLIYSLARLEQLGVKVAIVTAGPLVFLGEMSYSMYILHAPLIDAVDAVVRANHLNEALPTGIVALASLLLVFIASAVTYVAIEKPCRKLIRRQSWRVKELQRLVGIGWLPRRPGPDPVT